MTRLLCSSLKLRIFALLCVSFFCINFLRPALHELSHYLSKSRCIEFYKVKNSGPTQSAGLNAEPCATLKLLSTAALLNNLLLFSFLFFKKCFELIAHNSFHIKKHFYAQPHFGLCFNCGPPMLFL